MKKPFFKLLLFFTISIFLTTSSSFSQIKYFKNYRFNEWDFAITGIDSITETKALKTRCNKFVYDSTGTLIEISGRALGLAYFDSQEEVYKIKISYTDTSIALFYLDNQNKPMANKKKNIFGKEFLKLRNGYNLYFLDQNKKRTTNQNNIHYISYKIDKHQNTIEKQFYDLTNSPIQNNIRVFRVQNRYNQQKQIIETRYYDNESKLQNNTFNFAIIKFNYNKDGVLVEKRYFDANENPAATFPFKMSIEKK